MNPSEIKNISSAFNKPFALPKIPSKIPTPTPATPPTKIDFSRFDPLRNPSPTVKPQSNKPVDSGFSLPDFSKHTVVKDSSLYQSRRKVGFELEKAFRGTLRRFDDRAKVAGALLNSRSRSGLLTKGAVKRNLRELGLRPDQVRAVRRKMGIF